MCQRNNNMSIRIESNFIDYYDHLQDTSSMKIYHRNDNMQLDRGRIFITLNKMGIKCLELKQVSYQPYTVENVVVYTDTKAHHSEGKKIMDISSALCSYQTYPSAEWFTRQDGITLKILSIGKRRFSMYFRNNDEMSAEKGVLIDIKEIPGGYNDFLKVPIYSIDYIAHDNEWIATDLNLIERLSDYGLRSLIDSHEVIKEIETAIDYYNR